MGQSDGEKKVLDGSAWDEFCDALKAAGQIVQSPNAPRDAFNRAEGYRYLTRLLRGGLESFLEFRDPEFPELRCGAHETIKLGADNPDNRYESCAINPAYDYRIVGSRGSVDYLGFGSVINKYASGGGMVSTGYIDAREMHIEEDGSFELLISQSPQAGNWLPLGPESNAINVRQTFQDRGKEKPALLKIERVGVSGERPRALSAEKLVRGLRGATGFVQGSAKLFEDWSESFLPSLNQLPPADQAYCQAIGGDPNIFYFHGAWALDDDEVLVIRAPQVPPCQTWNFQLNNWWMESLDYRHHTIHVNKHSAYYEPNGSVTVYVSHSDPGMPNWIETAGHRMGTMCWRWIGAEQHPLLQVNVIKLAAL